MPTFEEVEPDVRREWIEGQRAEIRERAFEAMRARYEVVLPTDLDAADLASFRVSDVERPEGSR